MLSVLVVKELSIQPELDGPVVNLYISNHFILLLEEVEGTSTAHKETLSWY